MHLLKRNIRQDGVRNIQVKSRASGMKRLRKLATHHPSIFNLAMDWINVFFKDARECNKIVFVPRQQMSLLLFQGHLDNCCKYFLKFILQCFYCILFL